MKIYLTLISLSVLSLTALSQSRVTISGKITNASAGEVFIKHYEELLTHKEIVDTAMLGEDGKFSFNLHWKKPSPARIEFNDQDAQLFLVPGDKLIVTVNSKQFDQTIRYEGRGAIKNNYLAEKARKGIGTSSEIVKVQMANKKEQEEFQAVLNEVKERKTTFFQDYFSSVASNESKLKEFKRYEQAEINYLHAYNLLMYPRLHNYFNKKNGTKEVPSDYYEKIVTSYPVTDSDPYTLLSSIYLDYLSAYYNEATTSESKKDTARDFNELKYDVVKRIEVPKLRDYLMAQCIRDMLEYGKDLEKSHNYLDEYAQTNLNESYLNTLRYTYNEKIRLTKGKPAPDFTLNDLSGGRVSLRNFRGKIVYLDIWASWCGPCLREIPYAKILEEKFSDKEVVFLAVSLDLHEQNWRKKIEDEQLTGLHLLTSNGFESRFAKDYAVKGIPRYYLIDKDGNIADPNAARPSSGQLIEDAIRQLLTR